MIKRESDQTVRHVVYLLKKYHELKQEVEQKRLDLELLDTCPNESDMKRNTILNNVLLYEAHRIRESDRESIKRSVRSGELVLCKLDDAISHLDEDIKNVIEDLYFLKLKWHQVCSRRYISQNTLNRYRRRGIDEIACMFAVGEEDIYEKAASH